MAVFGDRRRPPPVPLGAGTLHTHRTHSYSPETQQLLHMLMEESRLSMLQRRQLGESIRRGAPLPATPIVAHSAGGGAPVSHDTPRILHLPRRRQRDLILKSGAYEREVFVPDHPKLDKQREKKVFQDRMSFGREMPPSPRRKSKFNRAIVDSPKPEPDRFNELVREVQERAEFLRDMESLGQGHKYRPIIQQEIAAKVREMETIDRLRTTQTN